MKPFSLEEYLKNPSKRVVTRGGESARIICTDRKDSNYPIVALIKDKCEEYITCHTKSGNYSISSESIYDLFFDTEKKVGWVNIYRGYCGPITSTHIFSSKEEAEESSRYCCGFTTSLYLTTVKVEWEE